MHNQIECGIIYIIRQRVESDAFLNQTFCKIERMHNQIECGIIYIIRQRVESDAFLNQTFCKIERMHIIK